MVVAISSSSAALLGTCQYSAAACTPRSLASRRSVSPSSPTSSSRSSARRTIRSRSSRCAIRTALSRVPAHLDN